MTVIISYRPNTRFFYGPSTAPHRLIFLFVGAALASQRGPHFVTCSTGWWSARVVAHRCRCLGSNVVLEVGCLSFWHLGGR